MGFGQAVSTGFQKYVVFSGRARRSEFWWWQLFLVVASGVALIADNLLGLHIATTTDVWSPGWLSAALALFLVLPSLAVLFRRLHDTGRSGWWWVLAWVCCVGELLLWIFCLSDSTPGPNQYGPNPKGA